MPRSDELKTPDALQIRSANSGDFAEMYALDQSCFAPGIAYSKAELRYFLRYPGNIGLVAEAEGLRLAGFAIAGFQRRRGALAGRLITIDVRAEWRRKGVGQALMQAIEQRIRQAGASVMILEVAVDNLAAREFYVQHGFAPTGRIAGYYLGRIDALVMEKPLTAAEAGETAD